MASFDSIISLFDDVPWFQVLIAITSSAVIFVFFYVASRADEAPVAFRIPVPEQCTPGWEGELLDKPSIKVCCCIYD